MNFLMFLVCNRMVFPRYSRFTAREYIIQCNKRYYRVIGRTISDKNKRKKKIIKIERWHRNLQEEFLNLHTFNAVGEAQPALDRYLGYYNHEQPHVGLVGTNLLHDTWSD